MKIIYELKMNGRQNLNNTCIMKFVSDLPQIGGFIRVLWFPPFIIFTDSVEE
jgi:hypothetical protein